jgi:CheY-like chemotaxis protein
LSDLSILVVDDEPDVAVYLASVLEDAGFAVLTAGDGEEAMRLIRSRRPALISLDLVMPGKSGIRLLAELRRDRELRRIPVVIVSGHAHDAGVRRDLDEVLADSSMVGPSLCLDKPITPEKYVRHVCELLGVEAPDEAERTDPTDELRRDAVDLLGTADQDTLEAVLAELRRRNR